MGPKMMLFTSCSLKSATVGPFLFPREETLRGDNCISLNAVTFDPVSASRTQ